MRFDANVSILFPTLSPLERPAAATVCGFVAIEMWWPFATPVPPAGDVDRLIDAVEHAGVKLVLLNLSQGDRERGEHGFLSVASDRRKFRDNLDVAAAIGSRLGGCVLNALYGNVPAGAAIEALDEVALDNLVASAPIVEAAGCQLALEALNPVDFPLYGLREVEHAARLARQADPTGRAIGALFDVYNIQRTEGDLLRRIDDYASAFVHVQIADVPGRLRPGTGEVAFGRVLPALEAAGYRGYVGLEYRPSLDPDETFSWLPASARSGEIDPRKLKYEGLQRR